MRPHFLLWFLLPLATSCADSGHTRTVLKNTSAGRLTLECLADTASGVWKGTKPEQLRAIQASNHADTCFLTNPEGKVVLVHTLEVGDSLAVGRGSEAFLWAFTTPPLDWEAVTVRPAAGQPVRLTTATIKQFVTGTYMEEYSCCGEYERITRIFNVALPSN
ncbi:hypothetical protein [Hymenobacter nivis]|uniref:Uncharacterized protein n=1 Tax=Hymenobacter nivis TaxID=1850093 RepID=A0A502G805_9BACT|nr:hypothetical protein [Hymenobacter nivis]TPG58018.1 hypothetical protein EAH73_22760 [Hymenobacter nivis]